MNYATFNVQGLKGSTKKLNLADDFLHHKLSVMMLQETRMKGQGAIRSTHPKVRNSRFSTPATKQHLTAKLPSNQSPKDYQC